MEEPSDFIDQPKHVWEEIGHHKKVQISPQKLTSNAKNFWRARTSKFQLSANFFSQRPFFFHVPPFDMLLRPSIAHQGIAAQRARLVTFRPAIYLSYRASASSAAQTEPSTVSSPEQTFSTVNIRQSTKTFSGKRWTVLSIPKDGSNVTRWFQNERKGDQNLSVKQAILLTRDNMLSTFLPRGYPHSVTPEYKGFAYWQMWHNMAGSVTSGK